MLFDFDCTSLRHVENAPELARLLTSNRDPQMKSSDLIIPAERIGQRIFYLRGNKVMLSSDLADLYGAAVNAFNQAVRRNLARFPEDFMFQLNLEEFNDLKSQIVTSSWGGMRRALPYAEQKLDLSVPRAVTHSSYE
jgi:hypothetical protein